SVERLGDLHRGHAGTVICEDALDDGGLFRINFTNAIFAIERQDPAIAIRDLTGNAPVLDRALLAPARLFGLSLECSGVLRGLEGDLHVGDRARTHGTDGYVLSLKLLNQAMGARSATAEAIKVLDQNDGE